MRIRQAYGRHPVPHIATTVEAMGVMSTDEITQALEGLADWAYDGDALVKKFTFDDFAAAIDFMATARPQIDELNHHPEWTNVYNRVDVRLNSHDVGGVTERDLRLARLLDECADRGTGRGGQSP
jgi:4a-hydroxytetrahydrobiopterin dehydratase